MGACRSWNVLRWTVIFTGPRTDVEKRLFYLLSFSIYSIPLGRMPDRFFPDDRKGNL